MSSQVSFLEKTYLIAYLIIALVAALSPVLQNPLPMPSTFCLNLINCTGLLLQG